MVDKGKYWSKRKADGYCACCSSQAQPGMTPCPSCRQNDAIDQRRTYHERRDAEQCVRCWREAEPGRSRCAIHLEQARLRSEMDRLKKQQDHHSDTRQLELV